MAPPPVTAAGAFTDLGRLPGGPTVVDSGGKPLQQPYGTGVVGGPLSVDYVETGSRQSRSRSSTPSKMSVVSNNGLPEPPIVGNPYQGRPVPPSRSRSTSRATTPYDSVVGGEPGKMTPRQIKVDGLFLKQQGPHFGRFLGILSHFRFLPNHSLK